MMKAIVAEAANRVWSKFISIY